MTNSLPSGTVTFLFTDIEGSTKLAQAHPDKWDVLQQRHHAILQSAIESHNGYVFQVIGDAFCAAFHTASDSLDAAIEAQSKLQNIEWGETPVKVRMGIHTGEAQLQSTGDYHGYLALSRVQRLMSAGHGGQVLVSQATQELIRDDLPKDINLCDLGQKRLKDLIRPEHIYQLVILNLPVDFPPLKTLDIYRHNLPPQITSFIGREKEMNEIRQTLAEHRLVTLTGSGGAGKTRLSLQVAADLLESFPNGIWFVELASITDPDLIPQTILSAADMQTQPGRSALDSLKDFLREKTSLLVLDNCEHLIEACAKLADTLLHTAPNLKILASSREALGVSGEQAWHVPSLSIPDLKHLPAIEQLSQYEAVRLFIDRALLVQPHFIVTNDNAPAVAQICSRLDGIPLAIELAAARVKVLKPEQIAEKLNDRFRLLTGGSRTALPRQQTLRAMIDWSYDLLSENEKLLLRRLSIFMGGWTLEAAEQVCSDEAIKADDVLDLLTHLVDKSLVVTDEQPTQLRYRMLETVRQYSREKLLDSGDAPLVRDKHLFFLTQWAEELTTRCQYSCPHIWLKQFDVEHDNLRAALDWSITNHVDLGIQLLSRLQSYWRQRGVWKELLEKSNFLLNRSANIQPGPYLVKAYVNAGFIAMFFGDHDNAQLWYQKGLDMAEKIENKPGIAEAYIGLGRLARNVPTNPNRSPQEWFEAALEMARSVDAKLETAGALVLLGETFENLDKTQSRQRFEECLDIARKEDFKSLMFWPLGGLGNLFLLDNDLISAKKLVEEGLSYLRLGERRDGSLAWILGLLSEVDIRLGNAESALKYFMESKEVYADLGVLNGERWLAPIEAMYLIWIAHEYNKAFQICRKCFDQSRRVMEMNSFPDMLLVLAEGSFRVGRINLGVRLLGAMEAAEPHFGKPMHPIYRADLERNLENACQHLDKNNIDALLAEGKTMKLEDAIEYALKELEK